MKATIIDETALTSITPTALRGYALFEGWERIEAYGEFSEVYSRAEGGRKSEVVIPVTSSIADYAFVVGQLIRRFAESANQGELAIYRDLVHADKDVVRIRSPMADKDGSIPAAVGVELFAEAANVLSSAACSAHEPRSAYHVGKIQQVTDYMKRVRLGQTEAGSYVITLLAPVPPTIVGGAQKTLWPEVLQEPYDRQVTRMLASGLEATSAALMGLNRGHDISVFEAAVSSGVSANMCEAVASIAELVGEADVSITWARTRPTPTQRSRVRFERSDAEPLREVARHFRMREPRNDVTLLGPVTKLQRQRKQSLGQVTVTSLVDGRPKSVTVTLQPDVYERAADAHKKRQAVSLIGDLVQEGQRWQLRNARSLTVLEPEV